MNMLYVLLPAIALSAGAYVYTLRRPRTPENARSRRPLAADHYGMRPGQSRGRERVTYAPGACPLCWGSGVLEWLYRVAPDVRGLHACTRCGGSGRGAGRFGRA